MENIGHSVTQFNCARLLEEFLWSKAKPSIYSNNNILPYPRDFHYQSQRAQNIWNFTSPRPFQDQSQQALPANNEMISYTGSFHYQSQ